jgi:hypothetical protein
MIELVKVVRTCSSCPSQWDAWDADGNYYYLRYRFGVGSVERQPSSDVETWGEEYNPLYEWTHGGTLDGEISLDDFLRLSGMTLSDDAVITRMGWDKVCGKWINVERPEETDQVN